jgi:hypothetical protein
MPNVVEKTGLTKAKMKNPPACQYSIAQPVWLSKSITLFLFLSLLTLIFFELQQLNDSFQNILISFVLLMSFLASVIALIYYVKTYLKGVIYFTGQKWEFQSHADLETDHRSSVQLVCIWDLRSKMLLQIKMSKRKKYWVIIEYSQESQQWQAVRRAILDF